MISRIGRQPNIILILTDDQGAWAMGCAGNDEIITPNIDRRAAEGIRFTNFFCVSPACFPARASILTGMIPSQHGVRAWIKGGNTKEDSYHRVPEKFLTGYETYTEKLSKSDYRCGITGKWHLGDSIQPQGGFEHWHVIEQGSRNYNEITFIDNGIIPYSDEYTSDTITNDAIKFIEQKSQADVLSISACTTQLLTCHEEENNIRKPFGISLKIVSSLWMIISLPRKFIGLQRLS